MKQINIVSMISADLALRHAADSFFSKLELLPDDNLVVSFSGVRSISRSFAHEYTLRKKKSTKKITESDVPLNVKKMFQLIINVRGRKESLLDLDSMPVITVN
jgi:hypothetical protein